MEEKGLGEGETHLGAWRVGLPVFQRPETLFRGGVDIDVDDKWFNGNRLKPERERVRSAL